MKAGNTTYANLSELPGVVALFPLSAALLLPGGNMPLNVFEPRYLAMFDHALANDRIIGMIQPELDFDETIDEPPLCKIGCLGRITAFQESGDGRVMVNLSGICRFRLLDEIEGQDGYRRARIAGFADDLGDMSDAEAQVDRNALLETFKQFLEANELEADWEGVSEASTETLVNSLSMMSPYGPAEKQALLEAPDLKTRAETLIAITEIALARDSGSAAATCNRRAMTQAGKQLVIDRKMLELLVCPQTFGSLDYDEKNQELISKKAKLAYPVRDGVPILLISEARPVDD